MSTRTRITVLGAAVVSLLTSCATVQPGVWRVSGNPQADNPAGVRLLGPNREVVAVVPGGTMAAMRQAHRAIEQAANSRSILAIVGKDEFNAAASYAKTGEPVILVWLGAVRSLGSDESQWAALFGHETAHLVHGDMKTKAERNQAIEGINALLRVISMATTHVDPNPITGTAAGLIENAFSREQESAADATSVEYLCAAHYDPNAAVRLQKTLLGASGSGWPSFLSDHPSGPDRVEALEKLAARGCTQ